jgi:hypothetical protein
MKVWVLSQGEHGEGSRIIGIYTTKEKALEQIPLIEAHFDGGWVTNLFIKDSWDNGCDYLILGEYEVQ